MTALHSRSSSRPVPRHTLWLLTDWPVVAAGIEAILHAEAAGEWAVRIFETLADLEAAANSSADYPDAVLTDPRLMSRDLFSLFARESVPVVALMLHFLPSTLTAAYKTSVALTDSPADIVRLLSGVVASSPEPTATVPSQASDLSPREREVVCALVKGLSNKEIAVEMNVSVNTIMTHRRNIAAKLHLHSPAALTIYAIASGLVSLDDVKDIANL